MGLVDSSDSKRILIADEGKVDLSDRNNFSSINIVEPFSKTFGEEDKIKFNDTSEVTKLF